MPRFAFCREQKVLLVARRKENAVTLRNLNDLSVETQIQETFVNNNELMVRLNTWPTNTLRLVKNITEYDCAVFRAETLTRQIVWMFAHAAA